MEIPTETETSAKRCILAGSILAVAALLTFSAPARAQKPSVFPERQAQPAKFLELPNGSAGAVGAKPSSFDTGAAEQFKKHCPKAEVKATPDKADYVALFGQTLTYHLTVINRKSGDVISSKSSAWSKGGLFKGACAAIFKDWNDRVARAGKSGRQEKTKAHQ